MSQLALDLALLEVLQGIANPKAQGLLGGDPKEGMRESICAHMP